MNGILLALFLFAVLVESLGVGQSYSATQAMAPTLTPRDKFFTVPIRDLGALERGDIVVFTVDKGGWTDEYAMRLIGLPGDRVQMIDGRLHLNGRQVMRERIETIEYNDGRGWAAQYRETLPGGVSYRIAEDGDDRVYDNTPELLVPERHVFVLGDNRDNSADSRSAFMKFVEAKNVIGRVWAICWSDDLSRIGWVAD